MTEFRTPHFELQGVIASEQDEVDHIGIAWDGGPLQAQLTGLSADYDLFLLDQSGNRLAEFRSEGFRSEKIRAPLPPDRYLLVVVSKPGQPAVPYQVNVTPLGAGWS